MRTLEKTPVLEAILKRRAVRDFSPRRVDRDTIARLLEAAVRAPSAMNRQPWAFFVVQDPNLLADWSLRAKAALLVALDENPALAPYRDTLSDPHYNIFYNAGTLIGICAKSQDPTAAEDCCFAGENLMLAAHELGLGTCPIGFARRWLDQPQIKAELGIPPDYAVVLPLIVGYPRSVAPETPRESAGVLFWRRWP